MSAVTTENETSTPCSRVPVAIYARVSTDHQVGGRFDSCEHQAAVCRDHISKHAHLGWHEVACYTDQAYSGGNLDRPGIRALIADIRAGAVAIVLTYKLERILRSTYEWGRFSRILEEHGCRLLSPNEDLSDTSASGKLKTNILVSFAEYERLNVAEKIRSKMLAQAQRGMWNGGYIPFGYDYDRARQVLVPNAAEAALVRRVFERAAALEPLGRIADDLNREGFRTAQRWLRNAERELRAIGGKEFRTDVLRRAIQNSLYRGVVRYGSEEFRGQHEAFVASDLWDQANAAIAESKLVYKPRLRARDKYANLLNGIATCATCQSELHSRASGKKANDGTVYRYYVCANSRASAHRCSLGTVAARHLETGVVGFLERMATDAGSLDLLVGVDGRKSERDQFRGELTEAERSLGMVEGQIRNCVDVLANEGASSVTPELTERIAELRSRKLPLLVYRERLRQNLRSLEESVLDQGRIRHAVERLYRVLPGLEQPHRAALVRGIVERVSVAAGPTGAAAAGAFRLLSLGVRVRLDRLVSAMERDVVIDDRSAPAASDLGHAVEFRLRVSVGPRKRIELLAPFRAVLADSPKATRPVEVVDIREAHPIHRANGWQAQLGEVSVRSIAAREGVSPSLVSLHLKLLRLAPGI